jgi:hypothetical protein
VHIGIGVATKFSLRVGNGLHKYYYKISRTVNQSTRPLGHSTVMEPLASDIVSKAVFTHSISPAIDTQSIDDSSKQSTPVHTRIQSRGRCSSKPKTWAEDVSHLFRVRGLELGVDHVPGKRPAFVALPCLFGLSHLLSVFIGGCGDG